MKAAWIKTLALAAVSVGYSHALFGFGGQWAPAPSLEIKASEGTIATPPGGNVVLKQGSVSGLNGFGAKLWIDVLPYVDLELGSNFQWGMYDLSVEQGSSKQDVKFDLGVIDKPGFARIASDFTIQYPFLKLPPVVNIAKIWAGAGVTHVLATEVLNKKFADKAVAKALAKDAGAADNPDEVAGILADAIKDEGLQSGMGFHLAAGVKVKPPVVPIAAFADIKYHFLSTLPSAVDANSLTMELGLALAF